MSIRLNRDIIRFVCCSVLALGCLVLTSSFLTSTGSRTWLGPNLGADYAGFYTAGTILNAYSFERLYDLNLQDEVYHQLLPELPWDQKLPFVYPPFFALLVQPLALMPYAWSYSVWLLFSVALFLAGFMLTWRDLDALPRTGWLIPFLLAVSFEPVLMECWLGGQAAVFGFFWMSVALHCDRQGRPMVGGLGLALCLYKPVLLILILPMLMVGRRLQMLFGFFLGGLGLSVVSVWAVGWSGCWEYVRLLIRFGSARTSGAFTFPAWKFVDLTSFVHALFGGQHLISWLIACTVMASSLPFLVREWWGFTRKSRERQALIWSFTLSWTLVCNLYVAVYDTVLVVLGVLLTSDVLCTRAGDARPALTPTFKSLLVLLYAAPWISQHLAMAIGFQPYTLVLMAVSAYQFLLAADAARDCRLPWKEGREK